MVRILLHERIQRELIKQRSGVKDMIIDPQKVKFSGARHVARFTDNRETSTVVEYYPRARNNHPETFEDNAR